MNKKFVIFFFLLQIIFSTYNGITEEWTRKKLEEKGYIKSEEEFKREFKREIEERSREWKRELEEREKEMKEEREYLENTKTIKDEGDGVYRKIYENGSQYLCTKQSLGYEICKKTPY